MSDTFTLFQNQLTSIGGLYLVPGAVLSWQIAPYMLYVPGAVLSWQIAPYI